MSIVRFATGPKRSMEHLLGAEKIIFFNSRNRRRRHGGRVGGILSIRGSEVSPRPPMVVCIHVQSPTPRAWPLPSVYTYGDSLSQASRLPMICQRFRSRALWRAPRIGACGVGDYPTPDLSRSKPGSRSAPEKSVQFGPDRAPFPSKTSITRGPPVVAVAVSLDSILPHR